MTEPESNRRRAAREWRGMGMLSTVGLTLVIAGVIGMGIGDWVDKRWHTSPWGVAIGFLFGTVAGFVEMFRVLKEVNDDE